jgi:hypothetical protein
MAKITEIVRGFTQNPLNRRIKLKVILPSGRESRLLKTESNLTLSLFAHTNAGQESKLANTQMTCTII